MRSLKVKLKPTMAQFLMLGSYADTHMSVYDYALGSIKDRLLHVPEEKLYGFFLNLNRNRKTIVNNMVRHLSYTSDTRKQPNAISIRAVHKAIDDVGMYAKGKRSIPLCHYEMRKDIYLTFYLFNNYVRFSNRKAAILGVGKVKLAEAGSVPLETKFVNPRFLLKDGWHVIVNIPEAQQSNVRQ